MTIEPYTQRPVLDYGAVGNLRSNRISSLRLLPVFVLTTNLLLLLLKLARLDGKFVFGLVSFPSMVK